MPPSSPLLVELCAGSAALSTAWVAGDVTPPPVLYPYMGGKRRFARELLGLLDLPLFAWPSLLLVDAGTTADTLAAIADRELRARVLEHVGRWERKGRDLWEGLASGSVPHDPAHRAAVHLALQVAAPLGRPIDHDGRTWTTPGYATVSPAGRARGFSERLTKETVARRVLEVGQAFDRCVSVRVVRARAEDVPVEPARAVYIDPPYVGVTGYRHELRRAEVVRLALAWAEVAEVVGVSEHEAIPELVAQGWRAVELRGGDDLREGQTRGEVLTLWRRPR